MLVPTSSVPCTVPPWPALAVLLVSTEPADLVDACDRVIILSPRRPPHELRTDDPDDVLAAVYSPSTTAHATDPVHSGAPHA